MMEVLCWDHQDEFIYRTMYEIDVPKYDYYKGGLKVFGLNAEEILLQVITMCMWAHEYHKQTGRTPDPYLPYMLWAQLSWYDDWEVPTIDDLTTIEYRTKCKEWWKYLVTLLQIWADNNVMICIKGSPVQPMSLLAKLVKDTANRILPSGFHISWKHVIQQTLWYWYQDFCQLLSVTTSHPKHHLEEVMLQHHKKVEKLLRDQWHRELCPAHPRMRYHQQPIATPVRGHFDLDDNLGKDPYDPLKTPTGMPIQDKSITPIQEATTGELAPSNVVTEAEDHLLDDAGNNVSVTLSSQEKWWPTNFTSPTSGRKK